MRRLASVSDSHGERVFSPWVFLPIIALSLLSLTGCASKTTQATDQATEATSYGLENPNSTKAELFSVPPEQMSHVQVVTVKPSGLRRVLRLTGAVAYNQFETTPVITQVGGRVSRILVDPGTVVQSGQPMLYVASQDYAQLRSSYLKSREALSLAEKNYARAQDLYAHHAIAEADVLTVESARNQAQADLQAAEQGLRVLGIEELDKLVEGSRSPEIPVLAPIGGQVVERLAAPGQVVQAATTQVFTISNMNTVWVLANVYQHDLGYVHLGDPVVIQTDAYPATFRGRISYISPALDPTTRTLPVRIVTSNPDRKLKKDMYVTAVVQAGVIERALAVPDAAVLRTSENQPFVYVATADNRFAQRLVTLGDSQDGATQITGGLQAGERVVADGSLFLQFANSFQR
jgi:membrane fusion protein, heavy metal efflux system